MMDYEGDVLMRETTAVQNCSKMEGTRYIQVPTARTGKPYRIILYHTSLKTSISLFFRRTTTNQRKGAQLCFREPQSKGEVQTVRNHTPSISGQG